LDSWDHSQVVVGLPHLGDQLEPPSFLVVLMEQVAAPWAATYTEIEGATR